MTRGETIANYGLASEQRRDEWERRLGPLVQTTPAKACNRAGMPRGVQIQGHDTNTSDPVRPRLAHRAIIQDGAETNDGGQDPRKAGGPT